MHSKENNRQPSIKSFNSAPHFVRISGMMEPKVKLIYMGMLNSRCRNKQAYWRSGATRTSYVPWAREVLNMLETEAAIPKHIEIDKESGSILLRDTEWWTK